MGLIDRLAGRVVYLDTNVIVYAVEAYEDFVLELSGMFEAMAQKARS